MSSVDTTQHYNLYPPCLLYSLHKPQPSSILRPRRVIGETCHVLKVRKNTSIVHLVLDETANA